MAFTMTFYFGDLQAALLVCLLKVKIGLFSLIPTILFSVGFITVGVRCKERNAPRRLLDEGPQC